MGSTVATAAAWLPTTGAPATSRSTVGRIVTGTAMEATLPRSTLYAAGVRGRIAMRKLPSRLTKPCAVMRPARETLTCEPARVGTTRPVSQARCPVGVAAGARRVSATEVTVSVVRVSSPVAEVPTAATVQRPAGNDVVTLGPAAVAPPGSCQRYEAASPEAVSVVVSGARPTAGEAVTDTDGAAANAAWTGMAANTTATASTRRTPKL